MWNKVKAAIKAAKNAVIKAFRWVTGTTVKATGYSVMGVSAVVAFVAAFRIAVVLMLANAVIFGGAALVDAGTVITGDGPVEIGQTYEAFMFDEDEEIINIGVRIAEAKEQEAERKVRLDKASEDLKKASDETYKLIAEAEKSIKELALSEEDQEMLDKILEDAPNKLRSFTKDNSKDAIQLIYLARLYKSKTDEVKDPPEDQA